jgi:hypothetical protein
MSSLADLPELTGFFSYSRGDDYDDDSMGTLRGCIHRELSAQLGRSRHHFKIWQDKVAIWPSTTWESNVNTAIEQSVFFIPIVTPRLVNSDSCKFELNAFLARERELGRDDLIFPILYIPVPTLQNAEQRRNDPVLSTVASRHYIEWHRLRHRDFDHREIADEIAAYCRCIVDAIRRPWLPPAPRQKMAEEPSTQPVIRGENHPARHKEKQEETQNYIAKGDPEHEEVESKRHLEDERLKAVQAPPQKRAEDQNRREPEYWLHRVANERHLAPGDEPMVLVSFAGEDQSWLNDLHAFLEPRLAELRDVDGRPYQLWNFSDAKRGTTPGDEFPEIVAEKMWRCRAGVIVLSRDYVRSQYCRQIELPFLMWRWEHHKLMCLPLKIGIVPIDKVRVPAFEGSARSVILDEIVDDRQAAADFATSTHRERNLKELKEAGLEAEIEKRLDGVSRRITQFLKDRHGAREET